MSIPKYCIKGSKSAYSSNTCHIQIPNCSVCHSKQVSIDNNGIISSFCSKRCRSKSTSQPQLVVQGRPLYQMCKKIAFYDNDRQKYDPGCNSHHSYQAKVLGHTDPR